MRKIEIENGLSELNLDIKSVKQLPYGAMRNTYLIKTNKKKYILKVFDKSKKRQIQKIIKILNQINLKKEITINPINKRVLSFENSVGFIYHFFNGEVFEKILLPNKLSEFGEIVGEFNSKTLKFSKIRNKSSKSFIEAEIKKFRETIKFLSKNKRIYSKYIIDLFERGINIIENSGYYSVRVCLIHGDLHFQNVLYNITQKDFRIIDCLNIDSGFLPREIMVVISHIIKDDVDKNKKIIKEVLGAYSSRVKLTKDELKSIPLFMLIHKMGEVNWLVTRYNKKEIPKSVFDEFMAIDPEQLEKIINQFGNLSKSF